MNDARATLPIACTLSPGDATARARRWRALIAEHRPQVSRTARSVEARWQLDGNDNDELDALVASERECCAFATWAIEHHGTGTTLRISVERDTDIIAELFTALTGLAVPRPWPEREAVPDPS